MATVSQEAFPNTWRVLGLSVAAGYAGLGALGLIMPVPMAANHGLLPQNDADAEKFATKTMAWISVRDISFAAALFGFYYQGKPREMGTVILSGMILCTADCILIYQHRTDWYAHSIAVGAAFWGWVGWKLIQL